MRRHASVFRLGFAALLASSSAAALLIGGGTPASANECSITQDTGTVASLTNSDPNPPSAACIHVTNGAGVSGDVTNTNTGTLTGINGQHTGIIIDQGASVGGSIINSGTISNPTSLRAGIVVHDGATLLGDISNGGTISGVGRASAGPGFPAAGIAVTSVAQFGTASTGGHIINSGTISPVVGATAGILVQNVPSVGGITNSGTIAAGALYGIDVGGVVQFGTASTAGISNSGAIFARSGGIVAGVSNFAGGVTNSGTITVSDTRDAIFINASSAFTGGITNSGVISAGEYGITVNAGSFTGDFTNSGTITGGTIGADGVNLFANQYTGGFSNSGTISGFVGASVAALTFAGTISNSGTITGVRTGLAVSFQSTFTGAISNSGTISATETGIAVLGPSAPVSIFDSGIIIGGTNIGLGFAAVDLTQGSPGNTFTLGPGYSITGLVKGTGGDIFQLGGTGSGAFDLSGIGVQYTGFTTFNVVSGTWTVSNTDAQTQGWTVNGGTLAGTGTLPGLTVASGGTFAPGNPGTPGAFTVTGNLAFNAGGTYQVTINGASISKANVGSATLDSGAHVAIATGSTFNTGQTYTILTATGGVSGQFAPSVVTTSPAFKATLSYDPDDVFVTFALNQLAPLLPPNTPGNAVNVAGVIDNFILGGGTLPAGFQNIFNFTPAQLETALSQLSGQASTGAGTSTFQLVNDFFNLLSDMALGTGGGGGGGNGVTTGFAEPDDALPSDVALAYRRALKQNTQQQTPPQNFEQRWTAWGSGYGGTATYNGNAAIGSNNVAASDFGFAGGMDYHAAPDLKLGFALAGGGTNWSLAQNLGGGHSDVFQAAGYGIKHYGPLYFSAMAAYGNSWFTTNRTAALGDQLRATFDGQSYALRGEAGYRFAVLPMAGLTPYAAVQTQWFHTPGYSETDLTGGGFGLTFNAQTANDTRGELGARADDLTSLDTMPLLLRARLAWAHDWASDTALGAVFQALPGSAFTVNGAAVPKNSALVSGGGQLFLTTSWSFEAKFDGEFASSAQTYAGTGTLRYTW
jgi:uncharacterized protein with beta-barrel porin domain